MFRKIVPGFWSLVMHLLSYVILINEFSYESRKNEEFPHVGGPTKNYAVDSSAIKSRFLSKERLHDGGIKLADLHSHQQSQFHLTEAFG